jgi:hypothetical protein
MLFTYSKQKKNIKSIDIDLPNNNNYDKRLDDQDRQLKESGILLVQGLDPVSLLFSYITRQQNTLIGTYKEYFDCPQIQIDISYILNGDKPNWIYSIKTLQDLKLSRFVGKIIKYPYIKYIDMKADDIETSMRSSLFSLFKHDFIEMLGIKRIINILYPSGGCPFISINIAGPFGSAVFFGTL